MKLKGIESKKEDGIYYKGIRLTNHIPDIPYQHVNSIQECFKLCPKYIGCTAVTFDVVNKDGCHFYKRNGLAYGNSPIWDSISIYPLY